ncbi:MAG TPA: DUF3090 family protein [Candidatus Limnocylindrales bacterium]|nr:DUF3090 family protein [Candidatus Limnocylindrales bacterium]
MTRRIFSFDPPDRFVATAVGAPGQRTFYLQASRGDAVVSVAMEKAQLGLMTERLTALLAMARLRGADLPDDVEASADDAPLAQPVEQFRVGTIALTWDEDAARFTIEVRELRANEEDEDEEVDDDDPDGPDLLRVRLEARPVVEFIARAARVIAAGRPPCPFCGRPLDPQGHICPRRNGYVN